MLGFIINCVLARGHKRSSRSNDLITSTPDASENKHAESVSLAYYRHASRGNGAEITWLPFAGAGHELFQRLNVCLFPFPLCSTTAKPGVNPRSHMATNRK